MTTKVERHGRDLRVEIRRERASGESLSTGAFLTPDEAGVVAGTAGGRLRSLYQDRQRLIADVPKGDYVTLSRIWQGVGRYGADYDRQRRIKP